MKTCSATFILFVADNFNCLTKQPTLGLCVHVPVLYSYISYHKFSAHALHFVSFKFCMPKMVIQSSATLLQSSTMRTACWL